MKVFALIPGLAIGLTLASALADESSPARAAGQSYVPGLGEIMTLQQMRHAKLWLAGRNGNWDLASYELDELKEGFEDAAKLHAIHDGVPVAAMIANLTPGPLLAIGKALEARNGSDFVKSFDNLTAACNSCHQAANHGFIRIRSPREPMFSNQVFAPEKK